MNWNLIWTLGPKVLPLLPRLQKAFATYERLDNDPDVKEAIQTFEDLIALVNESQKAAG